MLRVINEEGQFTGLTFFCEGCQFRHTVMLTGPVVWQWNGDLNKPVLSPSILVQWTSGRERTRRVCHSFIGCNGAEPGQIIFLSDSTHSLAGQVRDLISD